MTSSLKTTTLADAHIHLFADGFPGQYGKLFPGGGEVRTYEAIRAFHNIERALVVGYEGDPGTEGNNRYIARLAKQLPWIAPVAFCRPAVAPTAREWTKLWSGGFYGISLYVMTAEDVQGVMNWSDDSIEALNDRRAIVSFNVETSNVAALRPLLERLPETRVLLSHLGMPGTIGPKTSETAARRILKPLTGLADLSHVGVKFSGFYACSQFPHNGLAPVLELIKSTFSEKRLYWGSDFSPALDTVSFPQTIEAARAALNARQARAVFGENLQTILARVQ